MIDAKALSEKDIKQLNDFENNLSFIPTWASRIFMNLPHKIVFLDTGNQCVDGDTIIYDPILRGRRKIRDIKGGFYVWAWDKDIHQLVVTKAEQPFKKEIDDLFTVKLSNGQEFVASLSHRVLTPDGYKHIEQLSVGSQLFLPQTNLAHDPSVHQQGDPSFLHTTSDSQAGCREYRRLCDERLRLSIGGVAPDLPLPSDVQQHKAQAFLRWGAPVCRDTYNQGVSFAHLSNLDGQHQNEDRASGFLSRSFYKGLKHIYDLSQACRRLPNALSRLVQRASLFRQQANETLYHNLCNILGVSGSRHQFALQSTFSACSASQSTPVFDNGTQINQSFSAYTSPFSHLLITSITHKKTDHKWDFTVPKYHNYLLAGAIHHNSMKTSTTAKGYVDRCLGRHPIAKKNVVYYECSIRAKIHRREIEVSELLETHRNKDSATWNPYRVPKDMKCPECGADIVMHKRGSRVFRFASETLPGQSQNVSAAGQSAEVKNTQYPEFKKWLPPFLIKKDITVRNPSMIIKDVWGGADIIVEFVSYNQPPQGTAGPQRMSIWEDEQPPQPFHEEQYPGRLVAEDGDLVITCTPADRISWMFDEIFDKACVYFRTKSVVEAYARLLQMPGKKEIEHNKSPFDVAVIQASTDDNPTLVPAVIDEMFKDIDEENHPEIMAIRRYGIFKQISGRIFKAWQNSTHVISSEKYFPHGVPRDWRHARGIDYHPTVPWACGVMSLSFNNELFVWGELNPSPEIKTTLDIAREFTAIGSSYKSNLNLIDPLATQNQVNTGFSTMDDLNRIYSMLAREELCQITYWQPWDTKTQVGRDGIRTRLKNSIAVGTPFNNYVERNGKHEYIPTMWVLDTCPMTAKSLKNWRNEEWANTNANQTKEMKETPQQKWSHFCTMIEGILKHGAFKPPVQHKLPVRHHQDRYFQGRVA